MRPIDIGPANLETIRRILCEHTPGLEVRVFGSRVSWTARATSDLDLALMTDESLTVARVADLRAAFTDSDLPFRVDIVDWASTSESFRKVIEKEHVVLVAAGSGKLEWNESKTPDAWCETTLDQLGRIVTGKTPPSRHPEYFGGEIPFVTPTDFDDRRRIESTERYLSEQGVIAARSARLPSDSIMVSCIGSDMGKSVIATNTCVTNQQINSIIVGSSCNHLFVYYNLSARKKELRAAASGSAQPILNKTAFGQLGILLPPLPEQNAIAHILGTLDDKIELNRRMSATLEAMARALFTSWFVDFDPVRAKMEGRDTGLPKDIADMFPDRLVDSELGEIPEGWPVESLADHFEAVKGVSYKGSGLGGGGVPLHNLNSVHEGGGYKYEGIKFYSGEYADRHRVRSGDVIVANTEQGHDRLLIGYAAIVPVSFGTDGIASHHIYRLRSRRVSWLSTRFLLFLLNSPRMHDLVSGYANGTTVNMLPLDGVQRPPVAVPPRALVETFDVVASCSEHRREQTVRESRTLTDLRDTLLPKLVSGELRVNVLEAAFGRGDRPVSVAVQEA